MEYLYSKIEICKALKDVKESINYFVTKDEAYGLKITRAISENEFDNQEIVIKNISAEEENVKKMIDEIISNGNDLSQIGYVVDDYRQQFAGKF